MGEIVVLSFTAALNPTLLTATTVMLLLPHPERLMLGYWVGAMFTGITVGLVIVFALHQASAVTTTKRTVSPVIDLVAAAIVLVLAFVLATGRDRRLAQRRAERRAGKRPPRWKQRIDEGTGRTTLLVGVLLSFPGVSFLAALDRLDKLNYSALVTVLVVVGFNLVQLILLEVPMVAFAVAPDRTPAAIEHAKEWGRRHGRTYAVVGLTVIGIALLTRGTVTWV